MESYQSNKKYFVAVHILVGRFVLNVFHLTDGSSASKGGKGAEHMLDSHLYVVMCCVVTGNKFTVSPVYLLIRV